MARWMALMSVLAMATANKYPQGVYFDTDSVEVGIDNRCSACISYKAEDLIGELKPTTRIIKNFGGSRTTGVSIGILNCKWEGDNGTTHTFLIPNS